MFASRRTRRAVRNPSNAENLAALPARAKLLGRKASSRLTPLNPLRESSVRRRNRVLSRPSAAMLAVADHAKRQRVTKSDATHRVLPTPPLSPGHTASDAMDVDTVSPPTTELTITADAAAIDSKPGESSSPNRVSLPRFLTRPSDCGERQRMTELLDPERFIEIPFGFIKRATDYMGVGYVFFLAVPYDTRR